MNYNNLADLGRYGDSQLVHMRPDEVQALGLLAQSVGSNLTTNPQTGLPEAWKLPSWVLPVAAIAATALTAGAAAPAAAGALGAAGAGTAAAGAGAAAAGTAAAGAGAAGAAGTAATTGGLLGSTSLGGSLVGSGALAEGAAAGIGGSTLGGSMVGTGALEGAGAAGLTEGAATTGGLLAGEQAAAPVVNMNTEAGLFDTMNYKSGGLLGNATDAYSKYGKPAGQVMNAAQQGQQMAAESEPPPIQPPQMKSVPLDLSSILNQSNALQQYDLQERLRKRQMLNQYSSNIGRV